MSEFSTRPKLDFEVHLDERESSPMSRHDVVLGTNFMKGLRCPPPSDLRKKVRSCDNLKGSSKRYWSKPSFLSKLAKLTEMRSSSYVARLERLSEIFDRYL